MIKLLIETVGESHLRFNRWSSASAVSQKLKVLRKKKEGKKKVILRQLVFVTFPLSHRRSHMEVTEVHRPSFNFTLEASPCDASA